MSSESDSEVFFDAEDTTPVKNAKSKSKIIKIEDKVENNLDDKIENTIEIGHTVQNSSVLITDIIAQSNDSNNLDSITFTSSTSESKIASEILPIMPSDDTFPVIRVYQDDVKEVERKAKESEKRRKKIEELRNRMLTDDDDVPFEISSEQSSLTSSVDNIFPRLNSQNADMFKRNTDESISMLSLGKVGLILGGKDNSANLDLKESSTTNTKETDTLSMDSKYSVSETGIICDLKDTVFTNTITKSPESIIKGPEPDLVASTKGEIRVQPVTVGSTISDNVDHPEIRPVVPPRRKKKTKPIKNPAQTPTDISESSDVGTSSPTDTADNVSREFEYSLDLNSATRGQYVVKPQDQEQNRGPRASQIVENDCLSISDSVQPSPNSSIGRKGSSKRAELKDDTPCMVRTRTDSGRPLTDQEILAQVKVLNLDTGEQIPLSLAEEHLPKCLNPLSLHIMRLTSEYVSNTALDKERESDEESIDSKKAESLDASKVWSKTLAITKQFGKNIENSVHRIKTVVVDKVHHARHPEDDISDDEGSTDPRSNIEVKMSNKLKSVDRGRSEFERLKLVQELLGEHTGAIWTMKFSCCGRLLATAGQDHDLRIWVLRDSLKCFDEMRQKFAEGKDKSSPSPSQESSPTGTLEIGESLSQAQTEDNQDDVSQTTNGPFLEVPFRRYKGHTAELLDVSWSKNYFILSSSMDKTVRLWHISRQECLCCFQHIDFVTAIAFHPRDDRYFLSGSLDGKLRLWNIPDKKVTLWNEVDGQTKLITAVNFCRNGKIAVVGSYDGRCIFYNTDQLKYYTQIHVRSSRGKNKTGRKISGIEAMPGEDKILVTSNDSRIRLYDLRDLSLSCKYRGYANQSSQIKASFSHDGRYIISGSENQFIYLWKTSHDYAKFSRRDRNDYWERIKAHNAGVTSAVFAPNPFLIAKQLEPEEAEEPIAMTSAELGVASCYVIVSADFTGTIKVFFQKTRGSLPGLS